MDLDIDNLDRREKRILGGIAAVFVIGVIAVLLFGGGAAPGAEGEGTFVNVSGIDGDEDDTPEEQRVALVESENFDFSEEIHLLGIYSGNGFDDQYPPPENGSAVMQIGSQLVPSDGVMEVFINGRIRNPETDPVFVAEIYVDDDFRQALDTVNIAWGPSFTEHFRPYDFSEQVDDGIYVDTVRDTNVSRFRLTGPHSDGEANVAVGNFSRQDVADRRVDGLTFVTAR